MCIEACVNIKELISSGERRVILSTFKVTILRTTRDDGSSKARTACIVLWAVLRT